MTNSRNIKESNNLLSWGEGLRENPKTILLSIPVLAWAIIWFGIVGNKEGQAGGLGHLGLTFKLLYKHHWHNQLFLQIAYFLFSKSAQLSTGSGLPTVLLKMAEIKGEQGDWKAARQVAEKGYQLAQKMSESAQAAYLKSHLGRIKIQLNDLVGAKKDIDQSYAALQRIVHRESSMRLQVWISAAELAQSEWYLAAGDKKQATIWANRAAQRAQKQNLKTRKLDADNLLKRISTELVILVVSGTKIVLSWTRS